MKTKRLKWNEAMDYIFSLNNCEEDTFNESSEKHDTLEDTNILKECPLPEDANTFDVDVESVSDEFLEECEIISDTNTLQECIFPVESNILKEHDSPESIHILEDFEVNEKKINKFTKKQKYKYF